jgi:hypothetical protein
MKPWLMLICMIVCSGCAHLNTPPTVSTTSKQTMRDRPDKSTLNQLMKNDIDRLADIELAENTESLKTLMLKLYKRNPQELAKSTSDKADIMVDWVFNASSQHQWQFKAMDHKQNIEALYLTFDPTYQGDRVLAFIVGLHTMLQKAHGHKTNFYITDSIHPQSLYNVARNIEIAAWKLSSSRKPNGELFLLSNELNSQERNLTFEREIGKMIGRTDLFAVMLAEKSQRLISRITQSLATAAFLPF